MEHGVEHRAQGGARSTVWSSVDAVPHIMHSAMQQLESNECDSLLASGGRCTNSRSSGTIINNAIFIGHCRGQPIHQPIKMT